MIVFIETVDQICPHLGDVIGDRRLGFRSNIFTTDQINKWHSSNIRRTKYLSKMGTLYKLSTEIL